MAAGRTIGLLPWNPDADVDPTRQAVIARRMATVTPDLF